MSKTKIYKFGFIADVKTVSLALKFPCVVSVIWKRGQKTAEVKQRKQIDKGVATFNEKLQIECNMVLDSQTQKFQQKKTKFTVVIYSDKGVKQAGEVYIDVSQLFNKKSKKMKIEKNLERCPDKNAKLNIQLTGYMKSQISEDAVSQASTRSAKNQIPMQIPTSNALNFKKKKKETPLQSQNLETNKNSEKNAIQLSKQNVQKVQLITLTDENKKLKQKLKLLRDVEVENQNLKRQYQNGEKKALQNCSKKYEELQQEYKEAKQKITKINEYQENKKKLERELCDNKDKMAAILNYAVINRLDQVAEELTNIYSNDDC